MEIERLAEELGLALRIRKDCLDSDLVDTSRAFGAVYDDLAFSRIISREKACAAYLDTDCGLCPELIRVFSHCVIEELALGDILVLKGAHPVGYHTENIYARRRCLLNCHSERVIELNRRCIWVQVQGGSVADLVNSYRL